MSDKPLPRPAPTGLVIDRLWGPDLVQQFLDVLAHLSPVELKAEGIGDTYRDMMARGVRTYVAKIGTRIVGTGSYYSERKFTRRERDREPVRGGLVGHIEDVVVHPESRGMGIGRLLVARLVEEARADKCRKIILACSDANIGYYESCGFRVSQTEMRMDLEEQPPPVPDQRDFEVTVDAEADRVVFRFPERIRSLGLTADDAEKFMGMIAIKVGEARLLQNQPPAESSGQDLPQ